MKQLSAEYNINRPGEKKKKNNRSGEEDSRTNSHDNETELAAAYNAASTLSKHGQSLPSKRRQQLLDIIHHFIDPQLDNDIDADRNMIDQVISAYQQQQQLAQSNDSTGSSSVPTFYEQIVSLIMSQANHPTVHANSASTSDPSLSQYYSLQQFCVRLRQHFLSHLQPLYLSPLYDVNFFKLTHTAAERKKQTNILSVSSESTD